MDNIKEIVKDNLLGSIQNNNLNPKTAFQPVQGADKTIQDLAYAEGYLYFATDTGRIYLDAENVNKIPLGGSGASVLYANAENPAEQADGSFLLYTTDLSDTNAVPKVDDLIINTNGTFFKVIEVIDSMLICNRIAVSGTGGGPGGDSSGGGSTAVISVTPVGSIPRQYIYNQPYPISFNFSTPSTTNLVYTSFSIQSATLGAQPKIISGSTEIKNGKGTYTIDIGSELPLESGLTFKLTVTDDNNNTGIWNQRNNNVIEMKLQVSANDFNQLQILDDDYIFFCVPYGPSGMYLKYYIDNGFIGTIPITASGRTTAVTFDQQSHGMHTIKVTAAYNNGISEVETAPLEYEMAWVEANNTTPIIWTRNKPTEITDHDRLNIEFMVYQLNNRNILVDQIVNNAKLPTSPIEIQYNSSNWHIWSVTNYEIGRNTLSLECQGTDISYPFEVIVNPDSRELTILTAGLFTSFDSKGRSNQENITSRSKWEGTNDKKEVTASAKLENFNWYNNGWVLDENGDSCLRISNGAKLSIPLNVLPDSPTLGSPLTFEFEFKVRNVKKYRNLVTASSTESEDNDILDDGTEDDTIVNVNKSVNISEGVFCNYYNNGTGLCLGTQEGFFSTGKSKIVNSKYTEDELINVSFTIQKISDTIKTPLIYMYINGVNSSIVKYDNSDTFAANLKEIVFNSDHCDVDLYKFRVYKSFLTSDSIVRNFIADRMDIDLYEQNQIVDFEQLASIPTISYDKVVAYNKKYPENPLMPYAVIEVQQDQGYANDLLPFKKGGKVKVNVDFVNSALDYAWSEGLLTPLEYVTKVPSFTSTGVEFDVQGTSSQGYPRRNYKGKWKKAKTWNFTSGPFAGESLLTGVEINGKTYKNFYMDNVDASESTFTWKADYMESSGTYNTGFANFINTQYDRHPLGYYIDYDKGDHRTTVYGFPMMVFQKHWDGTYEFIGRYNFNLDKACNKVIDFENKSIQPYVLNEEGVADKTFADIAECWEVKHNQGGRVAFKRTDFYDADGNITLNNEGLPSIVDDFEYRYNNQEDEIDYAMDRDSENYIPGTDILFNNAAESNKFIDYKYRNLKDLISWLCSTDTLQVAENPPELPSPITYGDKVYTHDNAEYRLAKFTNEFPLHLNKEYCLVYFIMTEMLIQYDSRGKNMMLASWGPTQQSQGNYVWFPIFYDIDTQLGVNNSGVPSWEYDVRPTANEIFSTPNSVLWVNFYKAFYQEIKNHYNELRTKVANTLDIVTLNGYYSSNPDVSGSYAMMGARPINMTNCDEYFKYIAPAFEGYINTAGQVKQKDKYFYCLQGTRELENAQFLRNRLNFIDSQWQGGSFHVTEAKENQFRVNANRYKETSDKYINLSNPPDGFESITPGEEYPLDTTPNIIITPHLKQFCSVYHDDIPTKVTEASTYITDESGERIEVPPSMLYLEKQPINVQASAELQNTYATDPAISQQLIYIPGAQYVASLGDLSTKYLNLADFSGMTKLREIILGNEDPNYKNELITKISETFTFQAEANGNETKPLLETVVFTNLKNFNESVDFSGAEKLKTFRALGTNIPSVALSNGTQIETLYLPNVITELSLIEPVALPGILTEKPVANEKGEFPKGLYIEGLTNLGNIAEVEKPTSLIDKINIIGGTFNYNSYDLFKKIVDIKEAMIQRGETQKNKLYINLEKVNWMPYRLVEEDETIIVGSSYKIKTDHYTFEDYTPGANWSKDIANGLVYEVNSELESQLDTINSFELLDLLIADKESGRNCFRNSTGDEGTFPVITGNLFVNNTEAVDEFEIQDKYMSYFPELNIFVKNVKKAYSAKFIVYDEETGKYTYVKFKDNTISLPSVQKISQDDYANNNGIWFENPYDLYAPAKNNYDFISWSDTSSGNPDSFGHVGLISKENWNSQIQPDVFDYTFYAIFEIKKYDNHFYNKNEKGEWIEFAKISIAHGEKLQVPNEIPYKDDSQLELTKCYAFKGYTTNNLTTEIVDVENMIATKPRDFYAIHEEESVYNNVIDNKYLYFKEVIYVDDEVNVRLEGYEVQPNKNYILKGKITLPISYNGKPVIQIGGFGGAGNSIAITHVFWEQRKDMSVQVRMIATDAFAYNANLKYCELPSGLYKIGENAFFNCISLINNIIGNKIHTIGPNAFNGAIRLPQNGDGTLYLGSSITNYGSNCFSYLGGDSGTLGVSKIQIGAQGDGSNPINIGAESFRQETYYNKVKELIIYCADTAARTKWMAAGTNAGLSTIEKVEYIDA